MAISFFDLAPAQDSFADALKAALQGPRRALSPKFLYDEAGADLFGQITRLPEYYPTRTEMKILSDDAADMAAHLGAGVSLIEFGASSSDKVRLLLEALERPRAYVPIDVSADHLRQAAEEIDHDFPNLDVVAVCADYTQAFRLPAEAMAGEGRHVGFFPGSTIGNLEPDDAVDFLSMWTGRLSGGGMLVGVDLVKDAGVLEAAYDDAEGITARFSLNLLARANRELGTDFDLAAFRHEARWEAAESRININLLSLRDQTVHFDGQAYRFTEGERLHVEYSYKYTPDGFRALARRAGFQPAAMWTDAQGLFSVHYLAAR